MKYFVETLFSNLPAGLPEDVLQKMVADFRRGDFKFRDMYIRAHARLATSIALGYGYHYNRNDELIGVALLELCTYPQRIYDGGLVDNRVTTYLLSRLHTVCRDYVRNDAVIKVPSSSVVHCGAVKLIKKQLPEDNAAATLSNWFTCEDECSDTITDILSCARTERERLIIKMSVAGHDDEYIATQLEGGVQYILNVKAALFRRYQDRIRHPVQTFLPVADYTESAQILDVKRLGKQRVECLQLLQKQFPGHPASKMWRGYEHSLAVYGIEICCEWLDRGFEDTCLEKIVLLQKGYVDNGPPFWLGDERLHASHRGNLLRKNWDYYSKFSWVEDPTLRYYWPVE